MHTHLHAQPPVWLRAGHGAQLVHRAQRDRAAGAQLRGRRTSVEGALEGGRRVRQREPGHCQHAGPACTGSGGGRRRRTGALACVRACACVHTRVHALACVRACACVHVRVHASGLPSHTQAPLRSAAWFGQCSWVLASQGSCMHKRQHPPLYATHWHADTLTFCMSLIQTAYAFNWSMPSSNKSA